MPETSKPTSAPHRNFYGRRSGKPLRKRQIEHMGSTLTRIAVEGVDVAENPDRDFIDTSNLFNDDRPIWLEIGFGGGEHLVHMAETYPKIGFIGCEAFINGVAKLVPVIGEKDISNVRVHMGDARDFLEVLPYASIDRLFLLYPDPWPKKRHHRRRFVNKENLDHFARVLKPGSILRIATDIEDYIRHTMEAIALCDDFEWLAEKPDDWREPWSDWTRTRYEAKAIREGRTPHYLTFKRR